LIFQKLNSMYLYISSNFVEQYYLELIDVEKYIQNKLLVHIQDKQLKINEKSYQYFVVNRRVT